MVVEAQEEVEGIPGFDSVGQREEYRAAARNAEKEREGYSIAHRTTQSSTN